MKKKIFAASLMLMGTMSALNAEGTYGSVADIKSMPDTEGVMTSLTDEIGEDGDLEKDMSSSPWSIRIR